MAGDQSSTGYRTQKKRLARAKIKRPENDQEKGSAKRRARGDSSGGTGTSGASTGDKTRQTSKARSAQFSEYARKEESKSRAKRIGIGIFAVVMALSMMLPSLAGIVSNMRSAEEVTAPTEETTSADEASSADEATSTDSTSAGEATSSTDESTSSADASSTESATSGDEASSSSDASSASADDASSSTTVVDSIDESYQTEVSALKKRLEDDPKNLAALLNLGKQYMSWGYSVSYYAGSDESATTHASELFEDAISYYDQYLALNDSNAVKVDRALCQFYAGDYTEAQEALEKLTEDASDYGPAWANLGMVYENMWNTEKAETAYKKAAEVDPDDEYGAKSFANQRLASLHQSEITSAQDVIEPSTPDTTGLSQTLTDASGLSF